jgi:hypothetical protein
MKLGRAKFGFLVLKGIVGIDFRCKNRTEKET